MSLILEILSVLVRVIFDVTQSAFKAIFPMLNVFRKNVTGEYVLITGAGSGIGKLVAERFASLGSHLILWDINESGLKATADSCKAKNEKIKVVTYTIDLSKREEVYKVANQVLQDVPKVDILINNAGIVTGKPFMDSPDNLIEKTMEVNSMSHFWTIKAFLPGMMDRKHGHIVTIASLAGLFGCTKLTDYCASKFAAVGLDESLRTEIWTQKTKGIHTTVVCPFFINTGMFDGVVSRFPMVAGILEPPYVADKIVKAILTNQAMLIMPRIGYIFYALKGLLPSRSMWIISDLMGMTVTMEEFKGRSKKD